MTTDSPINWVYNSGEMKKVIAIIVLGLLWCNASFAEIIFRNCKLDPTVPRGTVWTINLEKGMIRESEKGGRQAHWKINKIFDDIIITQEPIDVSDISDEILVDVKRNLIQKVTFNLSTNTVTYFTGLRSGATKRFKKFYKEGLKNGEFAVDVMSACDVENFYAKKELKKKEKKVVKKEKKKKKVAKNNEKITVEEIFYPPIDHADKAKKKKLKKEKKSPEEIKKRREQEKSREKRQPYRGIAKCMTEGGGPDALKRCHAKVIRVVMGRTEIGKKRRPGDLFYSLVAIRSLVGPFSVPKGQYNHNEPKVIK